MAVIFRGQILRPEEVEHGANEIAVGGAIKRRRTVPGNFAEDALQIGPRHFAAAAIEGVGQIAKHQGQLHTALARKPRHRASQPLQAGVLEAVAKRFPTDIKRPDWREIGI